jgi:hypothetical protein
MWQPAVRECQLRSEKPLVVTSVQAPLLKADIYSRGVQRHRSNMPGQVFNARAAGRCCQWKQQDQTVYEQLITTVSMQTNCILGKRQRFLVWVILFSTLTVGRCARNVVFTLIKSDILSLVRLVLNTNLIPPYLFSLIFSFHLPPLPPRGPDSF